MVLSTTAGLTMYGKISSSNTDLHQTLQVYSIPERSPRARFHLLAQSNAQGRPPVPMQPTQPAPFNSVPSTLVAPIAAPTSAPALVSWSTKRSDGQ
jgi:hypothetical protein